MVIRIPKMLDRISVQVKGFKPSCLLFSLPEWGLSKLSHVFHLCSITVKDFCPNPEMSDQIQIGWTIQPEEIIIQSELDSSF